MRRSYQATAAAQGRKWTPYQEHRAALSRRAILTLGYRARLADALIAQFCIDAGAPLISGDTDFRHFVSHCGLTLAT